jgi:hypothetical protein
MNRRCRIFRAMQPFCTQFQTWICVTVHMSKSVECTTSRVILTINYGLWRIMMYQYKFIKYAIVTNVCYPVGTCWWRRLLMCGYRENGNCPCLALFFFCELKITLKIKFIKSLKILSKFQKS